MNQWLSLASIASFSVLAGCASASDSGAPPAGGEDVGASGSALEASRSAGGAVYVLSNEAANAVLVFDRAHDGALALSSEVSTGGAGSNDALASEGSLALSRDGRFLFAVNPGSAEISVLRVHARGLALVDVIASGGDRPVSVTEADGLVYVLNAGAKQNISGFTFDGRHLRALGRSTRALSTSDNVGAAEIAFTPDADTLVVTEKGTNVIDGFAIRRDGTPSDAQVTASVGQTPYGFAFDSRGHAVVSDAFGGTAGAGATSSYRVEDGNVLAVSNAVTSGQSAPCWVAVDRDLAFVANTASGTLSTYAIARDGSIALTTGGAASAAVGAGSKPADLAVAGHFVYVRDSGNGVIAGFRVHHDGSLESVGTFGALPAHAYGLVAR